MDSTFSKIMSMYAKSIPFEAFDCILLYHIYISIVLLSQDCSARNIREPMRTPDMEITMERNGEKRGKEKNG